MPVREAIRQLVENGLAVSHRHRGRRVRELTRRELIQIYDVRSLLEVEATRLGAPHITVDALEADDVQLAIDISRESVAAARRRLEAEIQS